MLHHSFKKQFWCFEEAKLLTDKDRRRNSSTLVFAFQSGLIVACYHGYVDVVIALSQCPYVDVNWQDNEGNTALITAAQAGKHTSGLSVKPLYIYFFTGVVISTGMIIGNNHEEPLSNTSSTVGAIMSLKGFTVMVLQDKCFDLLHLQSQLCGCVQTLTELSPSHLFVWIQFGIFGIYTYGVYYSQSCYIINQSCHTTGYSIVSRD